VEARLPLSIPGYPTNEATSRCHSEARSAEESPRRGRWNVVTAAARLAPATSWGFLSRRFAPPSEWHQGRRLYLEQPAIRRQNAASLRHSEAHSADESRCRDAAFPTCKNSESLRGVDPEQSRRALNDIWGGKVQRTLRSAVHLLGAPIMPTSSGSSEVPREPPGASLGSLRSLGMAHLGERVRRWIRRFRRAVGASLLLLYEPSPLSGFVYAGVGVGLGSALACPAPISRPYPECLCLPESWPQSFRLMQIVLRVGYPASP
jgi:hypothetical protein